MNYLLKFGFSPLTIYAPKVPTSRDGNEET